MVPFIIFKTAKTKIGAVLQHIVTRLFTDLNDCAGRRVLRNFINITPFIILMRARTKIAAPILLSLRQ